MVRREQLSEGQKRAACWWLEEQLAGDRKCSVLVVRKRHAGGQKSGLLVVRREQLAGGQKRAACWWSEESSFLKVRREQLAGG